MSDDTLLPPADGRDPDMMAAELALGLLDGDERGAALRRVLVEPAFAQEVELWRNRFGQWFDIWPDVAPPGTLWARVERSIAMPAAMPLPETVRRPSRWWPVATGVASAAAAALLAVVVLRPDAPVPASVVVPTQPAAPARMLVAAIDPGERGAPISAIYDPATAGLRLSAAALASADQSAELWIIGADGKPHSLGLLRANGASTLTVAAANRARIAAGATLAVSLEAPGGSPTGLPLGPVVASGKLSLV
ncbi:anti-sigma factor domain-containing protein [Sphingomonas qilianensis]|uniref:Anti-sigma factor n=1 Tax=Sphingomonas qilianensis TaxID=1736690 RepID=A0ABU9XTU6_9SPHN